MRSDMLSIKSRAQSFAQIQLFMNLSAQSSYLRMIESRIYHEGSKHAVGNQKQVFTSQTAHTAPNGQSSCKLIKKEPMNCPSQMRTRSLSIHGVISSCNCETTTSWSTPPCTTSATQSAKQTRTYIFSSVKHRHSSQVEEVGIREAEAGYRPRGVRLRPLVAASSLRSNKADSLYLCKSCLDPFLSIPVTYLSIHMLLRKLFGEAWSEFIDWHHRMSVHGLCIFAEDRIQDLIKHIATA